MNKVSKSLKQILTYLWLAIALVCVFIAIRENINNGFKPSAPFYGFTIVALFFFNSRYKQLKKLS